MKLSKLIMSLAAACCLLAVFSCKKSGSNAPVSPASVNVINVIPNSNPIIPVFGTTGPIQYFTSANMIYYPGTSLYSPLSGPNSLYIVQSSDTVITAHQTYFFNGTLNLVAGGIYSLFLAGSDTTQVDTMLVKDNIPYYPASGDSVTGVRFVNLSKGSTPVSITLQSDTNHTAILNNISYKNITAFQSFSANSNAQATGYVFEFRDQTNTVIATYQLNIVMYRSQTLALYGTAATGISVVAYNNY